MFAKMRNRRQSNGRDNHDSRPLSVATTSSALSKSSGARLANPPNPATVESPLHFKTFHAAGSASSLPPPPRPFASSDRPRTSDGPTNSNTIYANPAGNSSSVSLLPPVLPPIPRIASVYGKTPALTLSDFQERANDRKRDDIVEEEAISTVPHGESSGPSSTLDPLSPRTSSLPKAGSTLPNKKMDPKFFSSAPAEGTMEATMFPTLPAKTPSPQDPQSRAFVDSRDRSYYPIPPQRLASPEAHPPRSSSMLSVRSSSNTNPSTPRSFVPNDTTTSAGQSGPSSVPSTSNSAPSSRPSMLNQAQASHSQLNAALAPPSTASNLRNPAASTSPRPELMTTRSDSNLAVSAQEPRPQSSSSKRPSPIRTGIPSSPTYPSSTLGTPYQDTSPSFPLPQHVATRPQTAGTKASIAGIDVPTHHTSSSALKSDAKPEGKRKTRLLRPMAFLSRKRSGQDADLSLKLSDHERTAQEQAFARQKSVAAAGVNKLPEDFDPRIKGNVVHDFSSPRRATRTSSILHGESLPHQRQTSATAGDNVADGLYSTHSKQTSMASSRQSTHSPVFREHLGEDLDADRRASLLNAETRENKQFVQRASRQSVHAALNQDTAALPPFARRSQQLDPLQIGLDPDMQRSSAGSSDPTRHSKQESATSSSSLISPITTRNSMMTGYKEGGSPVSPSSARLSSPVEGPIKPSFWGVPPEKDKVTSDVLESSTTSQDDAPSTPAKQNLVDGFSPSLSPGSPNDDVEAPITVAKRATSNRASKSPPTPSENRGSAIRHSLRGPTPRHHASNASRFSFQIGERNAEEAALEEKHRKIVKTSAAQPARAFSPYEDEDDYFDEDAMDDMDEMEMQEQHSFADQAPVASSIPNETWNMQDARRQMQADSDEDSNDSLYEDRPSTGYSWQQTPREELPAHHSRMASNASQSTADTNIIGDFPVHDVSMTGFYKQPEAAKHKLSIPEPAAIDINETQRPPRPPLPHRDSGNSERNRVASGFSFSSPVSPSPLTQPQTQPSSQQAPSVANFSGFNFEDDEQLPMFHSRPPSMLPSHGAKDSETLPVTGRWSDLQQQALDRKPSLPRPTTAGKGKESAPYSGRIGAGIRARNANVNQNMQYAADDADGIGDDLYFDDGGFEQDIRRPPSAGKPLDEDVFDDPAFLRRDGPSHMRDHSDVTVTSTSSDGPYPTFAMGSNSTRVLHRQSQLLLEDLPLQSHNDPKLIPQRNPSEDAKRLGLSLKVPPLPPPAGNKEAHLQMRHNLENYHAALANAANKAAADGRFARAPSASTTRSDPAGDDDSVYSVGLADKSNPQTTTTLDRALSVDTSSPTANQLALPVLGKMSFDFGFGGAFGEGASLDDYDNGDDDIIAAANAEALAIDEDGFYGQEFDFYAKARPSSSDAESINGGFFGEDGDDGLARNMSFKEPNLTPITERSEFSTRNSFVHLGHGSFYGPPSAGPLGPNSPSLTRLPISPLLEHEATSFDQLRQLRKNAFGGSDGSLQSDGKGSTSRSFVNQSPTLGARLPVFAPQHQYFVGPNVDSSGSSDPSPVSQHYAESPQSGHSPAFDPDATPRKAHQPSPEPPRTVRKASNPSATQSTSNPADKPTHTRKGSDSVTYVREEDPSGSGQPRWVLERRRASQQGQFELIGREVVQNGWI